MFKQNFDKIILVFLLSIYIFLQSNFLLLEPRIWPDEAYIADVANNILTKGVGGTTLWGDTIVGMKESLYWYPPIFTNALVLWFKVLGFSILNQRVLSVIFGAILLIVLYLFIQDFFNEYSTKKRKIIGLSLVLFLIFDNAFLKASKIGRPEILVALLGFLSLYIFNLSKKVDRKKILYVLSGLFSALAFLTHFIGGFFFFIIFCQILLKNKIKVLKSKEFYLFVLGFISPVILWLISIFPNYFIFFEQLSLQSSFRSQVNSYIEAVFSLYSMQQRIIYTIYILSSLIVFISLVLKRSLTNFFLIAGLFTSWLICLFGKLEWYSIYIIVFLYPSILLIVVKNYFKWISILAVILLASLFVINVRIYLDLFNLYKNKNDAYYLFGQEVKAKIPEGKTVYLSTTPDLYFILKNRNPLYEFPGVKPLIKEYLSLLSDSDYIVINFHLEHLFVGTLLDRYIEVNKLREYGVSTADLYQAQIIELIPKDKRQVPKL